MSTNRKADSLYLVVIYHAYGGYSIGFFRPSGMTERSATCAQVSALMTAIEGRGAHPSVDLHNGGIRISYVL